MEVLRFLVEDHPAFTVIALFMIVLIVDAARGSK